MTIGSKKLAMSKSDDEMVKAVGMEQEEECRR